MVLKKVWHWNSYAERKPLAVSVYQFVSSGRLRRSFLMPAVGQLCAQYLFTFRRNEASLVSPVSPRGNCYVDHQDVVPLFLTNSSCKLHAVSCIFRPDCRDVAHSSSSSCSSSSSRCVRVSGKVPLKSVHLRLIDWPRPAPRRVAQPSSAF